MTTLDTAPSIASVSLPDSDRDPEAFARYADRVYQFLPQPDGSVEVRLDQDSNE